MKLCENTVLREKLLMLRIKLVWEQNEQQERAYREQKNQEYFERLDTMINEEDIF